VVCATVRGRSCDVTASKMPDMLGSMTRRDRR